MAANNSPLAALIGAVVIPGDDLGSADNFEAGAGTYIVAGRVKASLAGQLASDAQPADGSAAAERPTLSVVREHTAGAALVPEVGQLVLARVTRIAALVAHAEILLVDGQPLTTAFNAVVRREHIKDGMIDTVKMEDCFRPGDIIQAVVASLGDARSYFLSTNRIDCGVVQGRSDAGTTLTALSHDSMIDDAGRVEKRKVAKVVEAV